MTENKGDLISRETLKKALSEPLYRSTIKDFGEVIKYTHIMNIINNAPTVEPFEPDYVGAERLKARQRGYEEGYHNGMEIGKTLNPKIKQGEWLPNYTSQFFNPGKKCSLCGKIVEFSENYCPNCGAIMKEVKK